MLEKKLIKLKLQIKMNLHKFCIVGDCISVVVEAHLDSEKCFTSAEV